MSNETSMCSCEHARKWHTCGVGSCSQCGCNGYDGPTAELTSDQLAAIADHVVKAMKGQFIADPSAEELCDVTGTWWVRKDVADNRVRQVAARAESTEESWNAAIDKIKALEIRLGDLTERAEIDSTRAGYAARELMARAATAERERDELRTQLKAAQDANESRMASAKAAIDDLRSKLENAWSLLAVKSADLAQATHDLKAARAKLDGVFVALHTGDQVPR